MKYATFEEWMKEVDNKISSLFGLTSQDLPDVCYMDWFEDGCSPANAAKRAIRNAGE